MPRKYVKGKCEIYGEIRAKELKEEISKRYSGVGNPMSYKHRKITTSEQ